MRNDRQKTIKDRNYITMVHPLFFKNALFSDTTENYVSPAEPAAYGKVTISFRTGKSNVDAVYLVSGGEEHPMDITSSDRSFDYYSCDIYLNDTEFLYYFKIYVGASFCIYDAIGFNRKGCSDNPFSIIPGFHTPNWAKGAVIYQIYTERFCNGDSTNDVENGEYYYVGGLTQKIDDWNKVPAVDGTKEFYGGDLQGVINKLDYLKDLGVEAIYFNPLFVSPSNHKYDSQDYEHIDPHFGKIVEDGGECLNPGDTNNQNASKYQLRVSSLKNLEASDALFAELVSKAHERGIKVILDGVFNHCGSFNKWLDRERIYEGKEDYAPGAYVSENSPYRKYFDFRDGNAWPYNPSYDGWWGYDTLPKLNYEASPELYNKIIEVAQKWIAPPYNIDGWRLDVAADLGHSQEFNHAFYKRLRQAIKDINPEALILAEHYGDPKSWLNGKEWDSVMNYDAFMEPVTWFLTGMQKHSDDYRPDMQCNAEAFLASMLYAGNRFTNSSKEVAMNQLSNHDHSRFLTRTNHKVGRIGNLGAEAAGEGIDKAVMRLAVMMQFTWVGAPTIYYGDEAGVVGFTDPDNRRTYPWGHEDMELINFHKEAIRIHKEYPELKTGSIRMLYSEYGVVSYARFSRDRAVIVVINREDREKRVSIPVRDAVSARDKVLEKLLVTSRDGFSAEKEIIEMQRGMAELTLGPASGIVLCTKLKD